MLGCGTRTFTDPDEYCAHFPGANISLVVTGNDEFRARVVWVNLHRLSLATIEERAPRVAFVSLSPTRIFASFPLRSDPPVFINGVRLRRGEIVLHAQGEQFHQRSTGLTRRGLISLAARDFADYGKALLGASLVLPPTASIVRPPRNVTTQIMRVHRQACELAMEKPEMIAHREVARAIEQDLISALVSGLGVGTICICSKTRRRHAEIMAHFEGALAQQHARHIPGPELSRALGVPERTLRMYCMAFLGRGPADYARLRRLNHVRSALAHSDPAQTNVATIAREHGFSEPGRFSAIYRAVFGEMPSTTLRRGCAT